VNRTPALGNPGIQAMERSMISFRAPRIISILQRLCKHEKAAKEAAEQEDLVSTLGEIA